MILSLKKVEYVVAFDLIFKLKYVFVSAGTPTTAGYLTQGSSAKVPLQPPPVYKEDTSVRPDGL